MLYELRFKAGGAERVEADKALSAEQMAALDAGLAQLVAIGDDDQVVVLADVEQLEDGRPS